MLLLLLLLFHLLFLLMMFLLLLLFLMLLLLLLHQLPSLVMLAFYSCSHSVLFSLLLLLLSLTNISHVLQALEDFFWQSVDLLERLDSMRDELNHNDFADDVNGAKAAMEGHNEAKRRILKVPVENIDNVGQRLLQRYIHMGPI